MFFIFVVCSTASQKVTLFAVIEVLKGEYNGFIIVVFQSRFKSDTETFDTSDTSSMKQVLSFYLL